MPKAELNKGKKVATHEDIPVPVIVESSSEQDDAVRRVNREYKFQAQRKFTAAYDSRKRYDWEWLTRDLFRRGYQFSRYNPSNRTVILSTRSMAKIPINILWAQMRTIKNQVVNFRPKWEVSPKGKSEEAVNNARYSGRLLDYYFEKLRLRKKIKETVIQGLITSVGGPWQIGYDEHADNGKGEVYIWLLDPFDFFIDPAATSLEEAEYCIKAVRKPLDEITKNPNYEFYEVPEHGEMMQAASEYKQFLLQALKYQQPNDDNSEGAILRECWSKVRVGTDNKDQIIEELKANDQDVEGLRMGETLMRVVTYLDFIVDPLKVQLIRRSDFPFVIYQADINPLEIYGESWAKHVIPMNRVLNALESSIYQYNYKYAKGRIVIDKNSGVRIVTNEHGDIIEKNAGATVTSLPLEPLPASYDLQIQNMRRYIEDVGGAHDISFGRIPTGVKSGVGIAELKQADSTNNTDLVDNMEDFLSTVAFKLLKEIAQNYEVPKIIEVLGKNGKPEHFAVLGEQAGKNRKDKKEVRIGTDTFDIATIGKDNQINVKIGSWLAYTKEALYDKLKEYFEAGIIDQATFLEHAEFNDVDSIIEKTRQERILRQFSQTPGAGEVGPTDEELAMQENIMMTQEGKKVPVAPEDNHAVHLIIHQEFADDPLVDLHMREHEIMAKSPQAQQPISGQPQNGQIQPMQPQQPLPTEPPPPMGLAEQLGGPMPMPSALTLPVPNPDEAALMQSLQGVMQ